MDHGPFGAGGDYEDRDRLLPPLEPAPVDEVILGEDRSVHVGQYPVSVPARGTDAPFGVPTSEPSLNGGHDRSMGKASPQLVTDLAGQRGQ